MSYDEQIKTLCKFANEIERRDHNYSIAHSLGSAAFFIIIIYLAVTLSIYEHNKTKELELAKKNNDIEKNIDIESEVEE